MRSECYVSRQLAALLLHRMAMLDMTFAEVAAKLDVEEKIVRSTLMRGAAGKSVRTWGLAVIAYALDCRIEVRLVPKEDRA
jgi:cyanate lyase